MGTAADLRLFPHVHSSVTGEAHLVGTCSARTVCIEATAIEISIVYVVKAVAYASLHRLSSRIDRWNQASLSERLATCVVVVATASLVYLTDLLGKILVLERCL